ncbi:MAG: hypothetical protein IJQ39_09605 [Thermoguttaceae bacterium]|nr:hypothetical protein [Thermoguttaceae bacterium]
MMFSSSYNGLFGSSKFSFFTTLYAIVAMGYLASWGWSSVGFERPQMPPAFARWVDSAVPSMVEKINEKKDDNIKSIAISHFNGDPTGYVSEALRREMAQKMIVSDKSVLEKVYDAINLSQDAPSDALTPDLAVKLGEYAKSVNAQAVVWGVVVRMNNKQDVVDAEIKYYLIRQDGNILFEDVCNNESLSKKDNASAAPGGATTASNFYDIDWRTMLLFWALFVITLPLVTINFLFATAAKHSNKSNAFTLALYTLIDGIALFLMIPPNIKAFSSVAFFVCMILLAGVCNLLIMDFARKLKEE